MCVWNSTPLCSYRWVFEWEKEREEGDDLILLLVCPWVATVDLPMDPRHTPRSAAKISNFGIIQGIIDWKEISLSGYSYSSLSLSDSKSWVGIVLEQR